MATPFQPTLPAPVGFTEAELNFHDEEPPGLYPDNQNSNWGLIRKIFSDQNQQFADQLEMLYSEAFVNTASAYLDRWERDVSLPPIPGNPVATRRANILSRLGKGPFTRQRRDALIENFIQATFGAPAQFLPEGLALDSIPLYGEQAPVKSLYRVYEDIRNYSFEVWIQNATTPDIASLSRELARISPYAYTIDNTKTNVLDYFRAVRNLGPNGYWRMGTGGLTDSSGYGNTAALVAGPTEIASPGLLNTAVAGGNGAHLFNGTTGGLAVQPFTPSMNFHDTITISLLFRLDAAPAASARIVTQAFSLRVQSDRVIAMTVPGVLDIYKTSIPLTLGVTYHLVFTKSGKRGRVFIDGVDRTTDINLTNPAQVYAEGATPIYIGWNGSTEWVNGAIDEFALFDYELTQEQAVMLYNTSRNIP